MGQHCIVDRSRIYYRWYRNDHHLITGPGTAIFLKVYFFNAGQFAQVAWPSAKALAGQLGQAGQQ